jgi:hypothetical protein
VPAHFRLGTITVCFIAMCIAQFATGQVFVCVRVHRWSRVRSGAWRVCVSARRPYCGFRPSSASGMRRRRASQPDRYIARCCAFGRGWVLLRALLDLCLGARAVRALSPLYGLYGLVLDIAGPAVSRRSA